VIHHTRTRNACSSRSAGTLGLERRVKIMVYHRHSWKVAWILAKYGRGPILAARATSRAALRSADGLPDYVHLYAGEARALLAEHGLRVSEMWVDHIFPYRIPDYAQYRYVRNWYFRWMPPALFTHWNGVSAGTFASRQYRRKARRKAARRISSI
jgi:hypothetical protein